MSFKSFNAEDDSTPNSDFLTNVDKKISQLTEDVYNLENGANTITQDNYNLMKSTYTNLIRQIEQDLNKSIIKFEGKTRVTVINYQKDIRSIKRRFENLMEVKKKNIDEEALADNPEAHEHEGEEKEEVFSLLKNGKKFGVERDYYNNDEGQSDNKDVNIMREIIKDMNDISKRRVNSPGPKTFDIEKGGQIIDYDEDLEQTEIEYNPYILSQKYRMAILFTVSTVFTFLLVSDLEQFKN